MEEWCLDDLRKYGEQAETDPVGSVEAGAGRVIRGGSWGPTRATAARRPVTRSTRTTATPALVSVVPEFRREPGKNR